MSVGRGQWTRRQFSQALAASAVGSSIFARGAEPLSAKRRQEFAFVGTSSDDPLDGSIRVYRMIGAEWQPVSRVLSASPASLLSHPSLPMLYVAHDVAMWDHRPRGAVSAYAFDEASGSLSLQSTQALSLSATNPRHAVIAAGGRALVVAAETGGIYNLLPIAENGDLGPVSAIRKEFGLQDGDSARVAAPGHMVLGANGSLFATDSGQKTISRLKVQDGGFTVEHRTRVHAGVGPSSVCLSACGRRAYVAAVGSGSISVHYIHDSGSSSRGEVHRTNGVASLVMHPGGRFLIAADDRSLRVLRADSRTGGLTLQATLAQPRLELLRFASDGTEMVGVEAASGQVVSRDFHPATGLLRASRVVAFERGVTSLMMLSA